MIVICSSEEDASSV